METPTSDAWTMEAEGPVGSSVLALRVVYKIFTEYLWIAVTVLALFGNGMSILITIQKDNRRISTCSYMTALAVVDTNVTIANGWALIWMFWAPAPPSELALQGLWYLSYTNAILSGFYLAAMTVDRLIVVRFPMAVPRLCTIRRAWLTIFIMLVIISGLNIYLFYTFKITKSGGHTGSVGIVVMSVPDAPEMETLGNMFQLVIGTIVPFCIIVFCNLWIITVLRSASKARDKMGVSEKGKKKSEKESTHLTRMLIIVSIAYVVTSIPYRLYIVIMGAPEVFAPYKLKEEYWSLRFYCQNYILDQFWELNYAINFYLYLIGGGKKYRNDVKEKLRLIFSCCRK
ncbi:galanin receptor 2b-like [Lineus longissimus]|uniref:galanin receptor 2b-like n=1 Tax=Lineus longissimus TaxID=88925 RepID=UPI00315D0288